MKDKIKLKALKEENSSFRALEFTHSGEDSEVVKTGWL